MSKLGRNDPCHCGSGKKHKKCCLEKDEAAARARAAAAYSDPPPVGWPPPVPSREEAANDTPSFFDFVPTRKRRKALTLPTAPLDHPPTLEDFAPDTAREPLDDAIERLTLDWVGTVHQQHGVPLDLLGMAREVLETYLSARADDAAWGHALLIPSAGPLEETLWQNVDPEPSGVAAFLGLLPTYVDYLVQRAVIDPQAQSRILDNLWRVREIVIGYLRKEFASAALASAVEPIPWPEPAARVLAPVPPDLVPLLDGLRQAGEHPDRALLDRIVACGPAAIPPLIDLATDPELLFPSGNTEEAWAPIHAVQLLGEMQAQEAIEPLLPLFTLPGDEYVSTRLQEAFGLMGPSALPHLRTLFADREQDQYLRARTVDPMVTIARQYPETRAETISLLLAELDASANPDLNGFIIADLIDLQALEAMPSIERAFAEDRVDEFIVGDLEDVQREMRDPGSTVREFLAAQNKLENSS
jgi:hypothetical protein